eukprot:2211-Heterococcus_DN1.PRE.6
MQHQCLLQLQCLELLPAGDTPPVHIHRHSYTALSVTSSTARSQHSLHCTAKASLAATVLAATGVHTQGQPLTAALAQQRPHSLQQDLAVLCLSAVALHRAVLTVQLPAQRACSGAAACSGAPVTLMDVLLVVNLARLLLSELLVLLPGAVAVGCSTVLSEQLALLTCAAEDSRMSRSREPLGQPVSAPVKQATGSPLGPTCSGVFSEL